MSVGLFKDYNDISLSRPCFHLTESYTIYSMAIIE